MAGKHRQMLGQVRPSSSSMILNFHEIFNMERKGEGGNGGAVGAGGEGW